MVKHRTLKSPKSPHETLVQEAEEKQTKLSLEEIAAEEKDTGACAHVCFTSCIGIMVFKA